MKSAIVSPETIACQSGDVIDNKSMSESTQSPSFVRMSTAKTPSKRRDKDDTNNPDFALPGIGNYTFAKTLGEGNFAKVKLATHKLTSQEVRS
jgi:hypothetical protein